MGKHSSQRSGLCIVRGNMSVFIPSLTIYSRTIMYFVKLSDLVKPVSGLGLDQN